jgi:hypothetical protein
LIYTGYKEEYVSNWSQGNNSPFTIARPMINPDECCIPAEPSCGRQREAVFAYLDGVLARVEFKALSQPLKDSRSTFSQQSDSNWANAHDQRRTPSCAVGEQFLLPSAESWGWTASASGLLDFCRPKSYN